MARGYLQPDGRLRLLTPEDELLTDPEVIRDIINVPPAVAANEVAVITGWVDDGQKLTATYQIRPKTAAELQVDADEADRQAAVLAIIALNAGSGTAGERLARLEKVVVVLIKRLLK